MRKINQNKLGEQFLECLDGSAAYSKWLVNKFSPFIKGQILELGSGLGTITKILIKSGFKVDPSDINKKYLKSLNDKFENRASFLDISEKQPSSVNYDTIIAINVIEHIKDDFAVFNNVYGLLEKGGTFIMLVPAHNALHGEYDKRLRHYRRYDIEKLSQNLLENGFKIKKIFYVNKLGALGWYLNGKILKRTSIPKLQIKLISLLTPFLNLVDTIIPFKFGLSLISIAEK